MPSGRLAVLDLIVARCSVHTSTNESFDLAHREQVHVASTTTSRKQLATIDCFTNTTRALEVKQVGDLLRAQELKMQL
jgi:hypothetical protein